MPLSPDWLAIGPLSGHGVLLLAFTLAVFAVFAWDRIQIGSVCLSVLILLPALFFVFPLEGVEPYRFLGGFGHPALAAGLGVSAFGVFEFFPLVATAAVPALLYLWLVAPWLLRGIAPAEPVQAQPVFEAELRVPAGSALDGATVRDVLRRTNGRLPLRRIRRAGGALTLPLPTAVLRAGDRLVVEDTVEHLKEHEARLGTPLHDFDATAPDVAPGAAPGPDLDAVAAQLVVTPASPLVGRTVRGERLQEKYQLVLIGLRKAREPATPAAPAKPAPRADLADLRVEAGDVLLLQGRAEALRVLQRDGVALMLDERLTLPRQGKSPVALLTLASVVLAGLMALVGLLTNFVTNHAAAAIGTPLAVEVARTLGLPPEPFVLAVLFGCNLCYVTPMAYQTNLLVMNVAGYRFRDFVRVGLPLFVIMWAGLSWLLVQRYAV